MKGIVLAIKGGAIGEIRNPFEHEKGYYKPIRLMGVKQSWKFIYINEEIYSIGFSVSTISSFKGIGNKYDTYTEIKIVWKSLWIFKKACNEDS